MIYVKNFVNNRGKFLNWKGNSVIIYYLKSNKQIILPSTNVYNSISGFSRVALKELWTFLTLAELKFRDSVGYGILINFPSLKRKKLIIGGKVSAQGDY